MHPQEHPRRRRRWRHESGAASRCGDLSFVSRRSEGLSRDQPTNTVIKIGEREGHRAACARNICIMSIRDHQPSAFLESCARSMRCTPSFRMDSRFIGIHTLCTALTPVVPLLDRPQEGRLRRRSCRQTVALSHCATLCTAVHRGATFFSSAVPPLPSLLPSQCGCGRQSNGSVEFCAPALQPSALCVLAERADHPPRLALCADACAVERVAAGNSEAVHRGAASDSLSYTRCVTLQTSTALSSHTQQ